MPVTVLVAEDADLPRIFEISSLAFDRNEPFWDLLYPDHWTDAGRKAGAERMRLIKNSDPHTTFVKAVDETTGEVLGMAKWNIYEDYIPTGKEKIDGSDGDYWSDPKDREYYHKVVPMFTEPRMAAIRETEGNVVCLDILTVDPAHHRKMVGDALVKWGTNKADQLGFQATVESSRPGKGLYQKNGFVFIKDVSFNAPGYEKPDNTFAWLRRPKMNN